LEVYQVLQSLNINNIAGHHIPWLIRSDEELRAIEMSIVERPFLLDFAGAKLLHEVPDFEQEVLDEFHVRLEQLFGERWTDALHVAEMFRRLTGYTLLDIHPGNIAFMDDDQQ
jgi:hypothetical protein